MIVTFDIDILPRNSFDKLDRIVRKTPGSATENA